MASRWFRRNVSQRLAKSGFPGTRRSHRDTVVSATWKPSFKTSRWMRGARQVGFSARIRKISARIPLLTRFRPPTCLARESHFQYSRKPAPCQPTTVLGVTTMRGPCPPAQSLRNTTQNSLCNAVSLWRGRLACRATSCWRRARFSRRRSSRELRALKIQPRRCRSGVIMAGILPKAANRVCRQIFDSATTLRFDEQQLYKVPLRALREVVHNTEGAASQFLSLNRYSLAWPAPLAVLVSRSRETDP